MAEDSGIIIPMTRWLMQRVGEDLGPLLKANPGLHIAINLAPAHMSDHGIVEDARTTLGRYGIQPSQILFELTERSLIDDPACREVVKALGDLGTEVAIDDFGTGYSSLAYIDKFKLNYLKVDKAFVSVIGTQSPTVRLTDIIIGMATSLGLKTIAEGVETTEQAQYLRQRGVKYAQGWHFSKPLNIDDFLAFVRDNNKPIDTGAARNSIALFGQISTPRQSFLPNTLRPNDDAARLQQNQEIPKDVVAADVIQIVFELLPGILDRRTVRIV